MSRFAVYKNVLVHDMPFPNFAKKGVYNGIFNNQEEAYNYLITAEEKAFKTEKLFLILENESNYNRVKSELLNQFSIEIGLDDLINFDFVLPDSLDKEDIVVIRELCCKGFYDMQTMDEDEKGFIVLPNDDIYNGDNYYNLNLKFNSIDEAENVVLELIKSQIRWGFGDTKYLIGEDLSDLTTKETELAKWLNLNSHLFNFQEGYGYQYKRINFISDESFEQTDIQKVKELSLILEPRLFEIIEL